jgi:hypothetical protein
VIQFTPATPTPLLPTTPIVPLIEQSTHRAKASVRRLRYGDLYSGTVQTCARFIGAALVVSCPACGASPAAPVSVPPAAAGTSATNIAGTWTGTGTDAQGAETFVWTVTQTGERISGSVVLDSANRDDGSCGSCHKQKNGTLSGTLSGGALTLTLDFPEGGSDITPLCGITMHASTSDVAAGRIAARYTGTTTCEGAITDGTLTVGR